MFRLGRVLRLTVFCVSACEVAWVSNSLAIEPANVQWGPLYVQPLLGLELSHTDNLYRTGDKETEARVLRTMPELKLWLDNQGSVYSLRYAIDDGRYDTDGDVFGDDDYTDHLLRADIDHIFNLRNRLVAFAELNQTHEARGTGLTEGFVDNRFDAPIEYDHTSYGLRYHYGNWDTDGRLEFAYESHDFEYQNFRDAGTRFFDYEQDRWLGSFFWNLSGRSALLAELRYAETGYQEQRAAVPNVDSEEWQLLLGGEWQASGKTRGEVRVGYFERSFDSPLRETDDGLSWDIRVNWQPKTYSIWDFRTRRVSQETNGLGDYINSQEYGATWRHDFWWRNRLDLDLLYSRNDYRGLDFDDERYEFRVGVTRKVRRWLDLGVGYRYERRESGRPESPDQRDFNYRRGTFLLTLSASL
jgi:hypothetical protein